MFIVYSKGIRVTALALVLIISLFSLAGCKDKTPVSPTDVSSVVADESITLDYEKLGLWDYNDLSDYLESDAKSGNLSFDSNQGEYIKLFSDDTCTTEITDYKTPLDYKMVVKKYASDGKVIATYKFPEPPQSSHDEDKVSSLASSAQNQKVEITVWGSDSDRTLKNAVEAYNKTSPLYQVKIVSLPQGNALGNLKLSKAKGEHPDIVCLDSSDVMLAAKADLVVDLSSYGAAQTESLFTPSLFNAFRDGYSSYAIPFDAQTTCLAYNMDIFNFAKIKDAPETFEELLADAKKITETYSDKNSPIGLFDIKDKSAVADTFISWLYRCGGKLLSDDLKSAEFDSAMGERALQMIADLYKNNYASVNWTAQEFYSSKTAFFEVSSDRYNGTFGSGAKANFEAVEHPQITNGENPTTLTVNGYAVVNQDDVQKMQGAYDFILYYCTDENYQIDYCTRNSKIPSHKDAQDNNLFDNDNMEVFIDTIEDATAIPSFAGSQIVKEYIADAVISVITENVTPKDALAKAAAKTESRLARN